MLDEQDNTNTPTDSDTDSGTHSAPAAKAPRKRAPAKKTTGGEPAPARKRPAKKTAAADTAPAAEAADGEAKPARKRAAKKTAATPAADAADAGEPGAGATAEAKPKKKAAKKTAKKAGDGPATDISDAGAAAAAAMAAPSVLFQPPAEVTPPRRRRATAVSADKDVPEEIVAEVVADPDDVREAAVEEATGARRRRRRGRRGRGGGGGGGAVAGAADEAEDADAAGDADQDDEADEADAGDGSTSPTRRRRRRRRSGGNGADLSEDDPPNTVVHVRPPRDEADDGVKGVKGSTRLEAKRQRRRDGRETNRRRPPILTESEFLARRESVERVMAVRQNGQRTQIAVLEDDVLVEHYVTRASATSYVGNVYLGRVQNVLPSMEAAFIDIGKGRNGVLYAGEVNWDAAGLEGKSRAIEQALKSGDVVLVQVTKDPIGHKGARLTSQVSLPGRYLVYVPGGGMTGISRRLPDTERHRLKAILKKIVPEDAGVIVRTAAEGASEEELTRDVERLTTQWAAIQKKAEKTGSAPTLVHGEPDLAIRVVRDVFNEDFKQLVVQGDDAWQTVSEYITSVAPDLGERVSRHTSDSDLFHDLRVDEQLMKGLDRKVWLPSGGSLVIDRTEAMTVIDVNTGKFVGSGGNLEETVTRNNLEAAEEIVRQLRLRDVGGIVVIDFIDMVLESNRELVLRRLTECLGRDRTKHQVAEVTSLGLVQMTRKRVGEGLIEAFSEPCEVCKGRGVIIHTEPVDRQPSSAASDEDERPRGKRKRGGAAAAPARKAAPAEPTEEELAQAEEQRKARVEAISAIHRAAHHDEDGHEPDAAEVARELADLNEAVEVVTELIAEAGRAYPDGDESPADDETPAPDETPAVDETPSGDVAPQEALPLVAEEPAVVAAAPAPRRRRAASRPAGPPVVAQSN